MIILTALVGAVISVDLHGIGAPVAWLAGLAAWGWFLSAAREERSTSVASFHAFPFVQLLVVVVAAAIVRLYKLWELPLGPYPDEILLLRNTLHLLHQPFDAFGHTPLLHEGWVEIPNLYLYFNVVIVKLFGVSYPTLKLFSVIPGIITCGIFFAICHTVVGPRLAVWAALLFAVGHWPVRVSRYGCNVTVAVMLFSLALWFLILALRRRRDIYAYWSGVAGGVCLYSYFGAWIALLSLGLFLLVECAVRRERDVVRTLGAFSIGAAMAAFPLLRYYLFDTSANWTRAREVGLLNAEHPLFVFLDNVWRHALMFHVRGGLYARDNYPGLPMMDVVSGVLLLAGVVVLIKSGGTSFARLILCAFLINFAAGVFSISQEGAPYVARTVAVMVPGFLIVALGLRSLSERLERRLGDHWPARRRHVLPGLATLVVVCLNVYLYFSLEARNLAATRVMTYELRLIGHEIARARGPVYLVTPTVLRKAEANANPDERYAAANPTFHVSPFLSLLAIRYFSGRYDPDRTLPDNLKASRGIGVVDEASLDNPATTIRGPAEVIFSGRDGATLSRIRKRFPDAAVRYVHDILHRPILGIAVLPAREGARDQPVDPSRVSPAPRPPRGTGARENAANEGSAPYSLRG
ncbi:MAG: ArnT family glycosyltransferase [Candidatus Rokuibacteriota bacterium]